MKNRTISSLFYNNKYKKPFKLIFLFGIILIGLFIVLVNAGLINLPISTVFQSGNYVQNVTIEK